mmetsp:Transcript_10536/g.29039  ORF Transcript_10536/g.29039 Transcript_10536/m.29039 type:complete len:334 (-) Transcript_10536:187-1188(-)|eukprot:CAMPEP_0198133740 /NCGR_PEP_ID=MMETSP1442-20131203/59722_1 /TAXON_ID= /ORGANISM="Craspedostauros australis, Strain CCMP3328" /LENGTH=333 /DNA_ID=CAMNT_0043794871 /DNA_START=92 /DNA_END=1093 /DNA_ORIENTATION=-
MKGSCTLPLAIVLCGILNGRNAMGFVTIPSSHATASGITNTQARDQCGGMETVGGDGSTVCMSRDNATVGAPGAASKRTRLSAGASNDDSKTRSAGEAGGDFLGYDDSDGASKGIVSALTGLINSVAAGSKSLTPARNDGARGDIGVDATSNGDTGEQAQGQAQLALTNPVTSSARNPRELLSRLRDDYTVNNYLWTGKLDLACFAEDCTFTDPTLSFQGVDKYMSNMENLVPLVDRFCENTESTLLDIQLKDEYVEARWNMVGELNKLWWKPKVDVIGRTKFWFKDSRKEEDDTANGYRIYFYDESWELPAYKALLQLVTPPGTISATSVSD